MYATSMDQSVLRWPNPAQLPHGERRRTIRQKLHTPVYVSFNTPQSSNVLDLSELVDLHEDGFSVQTALAGGPENPGRLEVNGAVALCLDLPETKKYVHGSGQVMWIDDVGRAGVRFSFLPDDARAVLKEWLFANLLVASTNYSARVAQLKSHNGGRAASPFPFTNESAASSPNHDANAVTVPPEASSVPALSPDSILPGSPLAQQAELLNALDDVRREVRNLEARDLHSKHGSHDPLDDPDAILRILTQRAMTLTGASGAALALSDDIMRCRASVGEPSPPVGSEVDIRAGLSGECIRSGVLVSCEDSEADPRVDPEICRLLGIGSFMAAPIFRDFRVVGLLEVFSPYPRTFSAIHGTILERLVELIPKHGETPLAAPAAVPPAPDSSENSKDPSPATTIPTHSVLEASVGLTSEADSPPPAARAQAAPENSSEQSGATGQPASEALRLPPPVPASYSSLAHFVLLVSVFGTIAMVAGYLLAPTIEKHWMNSAQSQPGQDLLQKAEASSIPSPGSRRPHPLSLPDLQKLANQGDPDAQYQMGILYHNGEGVPQSDTMAVEWFQRAANQGYAGSQSTLGAYYEAGRGVPQDFSKAYFWSVLAVAQGDENSKFRMQDLAARMTPAQVAQARQQAEAWLHLHTEATNSRPN